MGFPAWFGKNSTQGRLARLLGEVQIRMRLKVSGDRREIRQAYLPALFPRLFDPLVEDGVDGVEGVIELMDEYYLGREEWDTVVELLTLGEDVEGVMKKVPTQVKTAFTRTFNKRNHPIPYHKGDASTAKPQKKVGGEAAPDLEDVIEVRTPPPRADPGLHRLTWFGRGHRSTSRRRGRRPRTRTGRTWRRIWQRTS